MRPNVILITMDTLRADHVGCYGAQQVRTATLDGLASDGLIFERAFAQAPLTWPSHAAILTGTYPFQNGVRDFTGQMLAPQFRSVAQVFQRAGYATGAVVSSFVLDRSWGLARGFEFYDDSFSPTAFQQKDPGLVDRKAKESVTRALKWLSQIRQRPFFLWLHLYDPHSPYDPPEPYRGQYRDHPYDGEIAYADHELGRLIDWLKKKNEYNSSLIVFVSDHGESLGEHGESEHGFFIYSATTRVPLIVKPPKLNHVAPGRKSALVETIAIAPTMIRMAGLHDAIEKQLQAPSLFAGSDNHDPVAYSETYYPLSSFGWSPLRGLYTARYHYIEAPEPELYDLDADAQETNNIAYSQAATVAVLKEKLQARLQKNPFKPTSEDAARLSSEAAEKLGALGYVAPISPVSRGAPIAGLVDPKKKLWELNTILEAGDAFRAKDFQRGKALLAKVREKDPLMYIVPFVLGEAAGRQQDWQESAEELKKCLELNPNFDQAMLGLARALVNLGQAGEARQWVEKALRSNPADYRAWYLLGQINTKSDHANAIADYQKAVAIQGNFAPLRRDLGMLYIQEHNYPEAAKHLAKAMELGLEEPPLFNFLGIAYSHTSRLEKAIEAYKRALALDPNMAVAHLNLGFAYERLRMPKAARQEYEMACRLDEKVCSLVQNQRF